MVKETLKTKPPKTKGRKQITAMLHTFDLPDLIEKMKHKHTWIKGELNAMVLYKSSETQIVLAALHQETEIRSFQADESATIQVIEGKLKFRTIKETVTLEKGQMLTIHENIKYRITAKDETVMLMTIEYCTLPISVN
jgi:quercetin dioxygenase-like cupin family protein